VSGGEEVRPDLGPRPVQAADLAATADLIDKGHQRRQHGAAQELGRGAMRSASDGQRGGHPLAEHRRFAWLFVQDVVAEQHGQGIGHLLQLVFARADIAGQQAQRVLQRQERRLGQIQQRQIAPLRRLDLDEEL
jgi:hypothetical protein